MFDFIDGQSLLADAIHQHHHAETAAEIGGFHDDVSFSETRKVWQQLLREGIKMAHGTVERLMCRACLQGMARQGQAQHAQRGMPSATGPGQTRLQRESAKSSCGWQTSLHPIRLHLHHLRYQRTQPLYRRLAGDEQHGDDAGYLTRWSRRYTRAGCRADSPTTATVAVSTCRYVTAREWEKRG